MRSPLAILGLCLATSVSVVGSGCPLPPSPERPHGHRRVGPDGPRVRTGSVLRLERAGTLRLRKEGSAMVLFVRVPEGVSSGSWQRAIDSQGNQFRVSPGGGLVTDGEPHPGREPASVANVAYYFKQAYALMAARYRRQGLVMAAEVLDLPRGDPSVDVAQKTLCELFGKLGITGRVRARLYRNLVGVAHRVKRGAFLQNHVHGFAVVVPLRWQVLANSSPALGARTTAMAFAFRAGKSVADRSPVNLLWITRRLQPGTSLSVYARTRLTTTAGSRIRSIAFKGPGATGQVVAYEVSPLKYKGRRLRSLQLFFAKGGLVHQLTLLTSPNADPAPARRALAGVLATFRMRTPPNPCVKRTAATR